MYTRTPARNTESIVEWLENRRTIIQGMMVVVDDDADESPDDDDDDDARWRTWKILSLS